MKTILLPGLDGTGVLFARLIESFPCDLDIEVISYESLSSMSYEDQAEEIAKRLEGIDVFIVCESYSGPVCYALSQILGARIKGAVFLASFISRPSVMAVLAPYVPIGLLKRNVLSINLLYFFGFGLIGDRDLVGQVFYSIGKADKRKLKSRLRNIAILTKQTQIITFPVTYIRPTKDLLVGERAVSYLASKCVNFRKINVLGGHFIAQSSPAVCAQVICDAIISISGR